MTEADARRLAGRHRRVLAGRRVRRRRSRRRSRACGERADRWAAADRDWTAQAGWDLYAQLALKDAALDDAFFLGLLERDRGGHRRRREPDAARMNGCAHRDRRPQRGAARGGRGGSRHGSAIVVVDHGEPAARPRPRSRTSRGSGTGRRRRSGGPVPRPRTPAPATAATSAPPPPATPAQPRRRPVEEGRAAHDARPAPRDGGQEARRRHRRPPENPLREGLRLERVPDPATFVLFGATGDLAHRKVIPALFQLWRTHLLPHEFTIVAVGRRPTRTRRSGPRSQGLAGHVLARPAGGPRDAGTSCAERIVYHRGDFGDPALYQGLAERLDQLDEERGTRGNRIFYLATPAVGASPRSSRSWAARAWTTSATRAAGGGSSSRSRSATTSTRRSGSTARWARSSGSGRSTASTTTWARRRSGTCWSSGSPTGSSSPSGTAATSTTCRSRWPSRSASRAAARSTRRPAPAATSSRTTCSSCSAWSRWSRRRRSRPTRCATRRSR